MSSTQLNLIIGIGLVLGLVGLGIANGITWFLHGSFDPQITMLIMTLLGVLQGFRHAADIKSGNGSSGTTNQPTPTKEG